MGKQPTKPLKSKKEKIMAKVEMVIDSIRRNSLGNDWVVILKEKSAERYLPIYIGSSQADVIKKLLMGHAPPDTISPKVESVIINRFENNTFYARLSYKSYEVDCPPANALALSIGAGASIFADEALLNKAGIAVSA